MSRIEKKEQATEAKKSRFKSFFGKKEKSADEGAVSAEDNVSLSDAEETTQKPSLLKRFKAWFSGLNKWKKIALITAVVVLVVAIVAGATLYWYFGSVFEDMYKETPDDYDLSLTSVDGYYNILLLGVDTRDMDNLKTRSDAMMVVSINEETSDVKVLSVYRDTYLKLGNTSTYDKTTHACYYGGPELTMATLNQALDLNISNYVVVNFKAVADLVDAVGGIEVDVQQYEIQQLNKYTKQTAKNIGRSKYQLVEEPGVQMLDGCQAVSYSRIRKGVGDDFKRTERMRTVVSLTMDKMKTMSFKDLKDIIKMMTPQIQTNLSKNDVLGLAIRLPQYNIIGTTGWPYTVSTGQINKRSYVFPNNLTSNVIRLHKEFFGQEDYTPSSKVTSISSEIIRRIEEARKKKELEDEKEVEVQQPQTPTTPVVPDDNSGNGTDAGGSTEGNPGTGTDPGTGDNTGTGGNTGVDEDTGNTPDTDAGGNAGSGSPDDENTGGTSGAGGGSGNGTETEGQGAA